MRKAIPRKKKTIILCVLCALAIIGVCVFILFTPLFRIFAFDYAHRWAKNAEFKEYESEFELVKDYFYEHFQEDGWVDLSVKEGRLCLFSGIQEDILLPDDVLAALERIQDNAFPNKDGQLDTIRIEKERVTFCVPNGSYALVWSSNGKPVGLNSSDDGRKTWVKQIKKGWYHVTEAPKWE